MKSNILMQLNELPAFAKFNAADHFIKCKVCGSPASKFDVVDFNKACSAEYYPFGFSGIAVLYYRCQRCGFIFTTFCDDWTRSDFASFIYNSDYPLVDGDYISVRPERTAVEMIDFLRDHRAARILDYGSGTGVFADRLKRAGFNDVHNYDLFSSPSRPTGKFDIITCIETIEHSPFPGETMADLASFLKPDGCIIIGTGVQPPNINELRANWWYIAPRNGHVSIYTIAALQSLGASVGLEFYSGNGKLVFAGPSPSPQLIPLLQSIGPTVVNVRLTAPSDRSTAATLSAAAIAPDVQWHAIEQAASTRFRWTRTPRVEWALQNPPSRFPCRLSVSIPVVSEISRGFAAKCVLEIGSRSYPVHEEPGVIAVEAQLDEPLCQPIALLTPEPQRPSDLRGAPDRRALGLAIALAGEPA